MADVKLSPPWITYVRKLYALFHEDPDVKFVYDNDKIELKIYVADQDKAEAFEKLIGSSVDFGNVTLNIMVIPPNGFKSQQELFEILFKGNPILVDSQTIEGITSNPMKFMIFKKKIIQFYDDNLGDLNGIRSSLYETIARDIFDDTDGVYFNTELLPDEPYDKWPND